MVLEGSGLMLHGWMQDRVSGSDCVFLHYQRSLVRHVFVSRTLGVPVVRGVLRQPVKIVFEQKLVAWDPLNRLQHVVLQSQVPTALLPLCTHTHTAVYV